MAHCAAISAPSINTYAVDAAASLPPTATNYVAWYANCRRSFSVVSCACSKLTVPVYMRSAAKPVCDLRASCNGCLIFDIGRLSVFVLLLMNEFILVTAGSCSPCCSKSVFVVSCICLCFCWWTKLLNGCVTAHANWHWLTTCVWHTVTCTRPAVPRHLQRRTGVATTDPQCPLDSDAKLSHSPWSQLLATLCSTRNVVSDCRRR